MYIPYHIEFCIYLGLQTSKLPSWSPNYFQKSLTSVQPEIIDEIINVMIIINVFDSLLVAFKGYQMLVSRGFQFTYIMTKRRIKKRCSLSLQIPHNTVMLSYLVDLLTRVNILAKRASPPPGGGDKFNFEKNREEIQLEKKNDKLSTFL